MPTSSNSNSSSLLPILLTLLTTINSTSITIPLTYAFDPYQAQKKYPIKLSFNSSITTTPFQSPYLPLFNLNITMQTTTLPPSPTPSPTPSSHSLTFPPSPPPPQQIVTIGLKPPSTFLTSIQQTYNIEAHQIEIDKQQYTQLILNSNNFVESTDQFVDGALYTVVVMYNYGDKVEVKGQKCVLVDQENVVFDQFLILEVLNSMDQRNKIHYTKDQLRNIITIQGNLDNFPKLSLHLDKSILQLSLKLPTIRYSPRTNQTQPITYIGYKSLTKFSKFQIIQPQPSSSSPSSPSTSSTTSPQDTTRILFKRTSQLYQLYLFLGYFFVCVMGIVVVSRKEFQGSMRFVRSVVGWVVLGDQGDRVRVLRTQLE